jgi:1-deoxy-D-xylulose-5-phosphate synthase
MEKDPKIVALTAAMPDGTGVCTPLEKFPERSFDVGIAEQHCVTFAAGMSCEGLKPVCAIYSTFLQRGFDQVIHDVCIQDLNVKFCLDRGGIAGGDGQTHHGLLDIAYLRPIPNIVVMAPKDEGEMRDMMFTMLEHTGPAAMRYPRGNGVGVPIDREPSCSKSARARYCATVVRSRLLLMARWSIRHLPPQSGWRRIASRPRW